MYQLFFYLLPKKTVRLYHKHVSQNPLKEEPSGRGLQSGGLFGILVLLLPS